MSNMGYCQWRNFRDEVRDALDIQSEADFDPEALTEEEKSAYRRCVEYCRQFFERAELSDEQ